MVHLALIYAGLLAGPGRRRTSLVPGSPDLRGAEAQGGGWSAGAGEAGALVRGHGLDAERLKHLVQAILADPKNATARGLMGLVAFGDRLGIAG